MLLRSPGYCLVAVAASWLVATTQAVCYYPNGSPDQHFDYNYQPCNGVNTTWSQCCIPGQDICTPDRFCTHLTNTVALPYDYRPACQNKDWSGCQKVCMDVQSYSWVQVKQCATGQYCCNPDFDNGDCCKDGSIRFDILHDNPNNTSASTSASTRASSTTTFATSSRATTTGHRTVTGSSSSSSTTRPNDDSGSSGSTTNAGAIAGGVVGGVAAIALVAGLLWFLRRRRRSATELPAELDEPKTNTSPSAYSESAVKHQGQYTPVPTVEAPSPPPPVELSSTEVHELS